LAKPADNPKRGKHDPERRESRGGTIRNFVRGGAGYHLGGCLNEALTERDGELGFSC
jgi:hypothetical protein